MDPLFAYRGNKLRFSKQEAGKEVETTPSLEDKDQFALEMDHMAQSTIHKQQPHKPGEEGLRDQHIIEANYKSAATNPA